MDASDAEIPALRSKADLRRLDGHRALARGVYHAMSRPAKGDPGPAEPAKECAVVRLEDGTPVWLERLDAPASRRSADERSRLDGRRVRVDGIVRETMPSRGQGILAPCLEDVRLHPEERA